MWKDPVVEEVRELRDEYAQQFNYDIEAICRDLAEQEKTSDHLVVTLPPKRLDLEGEAPGTSGKAA